MYFSHSLEQNWRELPEAGPQITREGQEPKHRVSETGGARDLFPFLKSHLGWLKVYSEGLNKPRSLKQVLPWGTLTAIPSASGWQRKPGTGHSTGTKIKCMKTNFEWTHNVNQTSGGTRYTVFIYEELSYMLTRDRGRSCSWWQTREPRAQVQFPKDTGEPEVMLQLKVNLSSLSLF